MNKENIIIGVKIISVALTAYKLIKEIDNNKTNQDINQKDLDGIGEFITTIFK